MDGDTTDMREHNEDRPVNQIKTYWPDDLQALFIYWSQFSSTLRSLYRITADLKSSDDGTKGFSWFLIPLPAV